MGDGKIELYLRLVRERVLPVVRELPGFSGYLGLTDDDRGATVNTFLRHGKRWPGKGMLELAGELLGHVIRMR